MLFLHIFCHLKKKFYDFSKFSTKRLFEYPHPWFQVAVPPLLQTNLLYVILPTYV